MMYTHQMAVEAHSNGDRVVAVAVIYAVNTPAPVFTYRDLRGLSKTASLDDFGRLRPTLQSNIVTYLKEAAVCWEAIRRRDVDSVDSPKYWACYRAMERLMFTHPEARVEPSGQAEMHRTWVSRAAMILAKNAASCNLEK